MIISNILDITDFLDFLNDNNILSVAIATILSNKIHDISESFVNNLILPIINRDANNDNNPDIKNVEDYTIKIYGIKFELGKFIIAMIKFLIITYIAYLMTKIFRKTKLIT